MIDFSEDDHASAIVKDLMTKMCADIDRIVKTNIELAVEAIDVNRSDAAQIAINFGAGASIQTARLFMMITESSFEMIADKKIRIGEEATMLLIRRLCQSDKYRSTPIHLLINAVIEDNKRLRKIERAV